MRETLETFRPLAAVKKISLQTDVKADSLLGRFDHERLLQVLSNLVGNAIKFTQEGDRIDIVIDKTEQEIRFAVADNGVGIAADKLDVVFDRHLVIVNDFDFGGGDGRSRMLKNVRN